MDPFKDEDHAQPSGDPEAGQPRTPPTAKELSTFHHNVFTMGNVQARLPDDMEDSLEELAHQLRTSRSEALRRALDRGLAEMKLERALADYAREEVTLSRAAQAAGVSIPRLVHEASKRGIARFRQSPDELDRDLEELEAFLDGSEASAE